MRADSLGGHRRLDGQDRRGEQRSARCSCVYPDGKRHRGVQVARVLFQPSGPHLDAGPAAQGADARTDRTTVPARSGGRLVNSASAATSAAIHGGKMPTGNGGSAGHRRQRNGGAPIPSASQARACACSRPPALRPRDRRVDHRRRSGRAGMPCFSLSAASAAARTLPGYLEVHQATTWLARSGGMTSKSPSSPAIGYLSDCRADRPGHLGLTEPGGDRHRGEIVEHWLVPGLQGPAGGPEQS